MLATVLVGSTAGVGQTFISVCVFSGQESSGRVMETRELER